MELAQWFNSIGYIMRKGRDVRFGCGAETGNRAFQHVVKPLVFLAATEVIQRNHLFLNQRFLIIDPLVSCSLG